MFCLLLPQTVALNTPLSAPKRRDVTTSNVSKMQASALASAEEAFPREPAMLGEDKRRAFAAAQ